MYSLICSGVKVWLALRIRSTRFFALSFVQVLCKYEYQETAEKELGRAGFEPAKAEPADLQSAPFGHFGTYPFPVAR